MLKSSIVISPYMKVMIIIIIKVDYRMKRTIKISLLSTALILSLSACVSTMPREVTSNNGPTNLVGESSRINILGIIALGDGGYEAAKHSGNITNVHHTDIQVTNYFILTKEKTLVYGTK